MSLRPSMSHTKYAAAAWTGGLMSSNDHSYAGSAPSGCWNHSRHRTRSWYLANAGSTWASVTAWNARSQAANHGYSHGSGMERMSAASKCRQSVFRMCAWPSAGGGWPGSPSSQRATL